MSEIRLLSTWEKFLLIEWKNGYILWHHRIQLLLSILMPTIFTIILVFLRFKVTAQFKALEKYQPVDLDRAWINLTKLMEERQTKLKDNYGEIKYSCFVPRLILAYAPEKPIYTELMEFAAKKYLNNAKLKGYRNEDELRHYMSKQHYLAGVYFAKNGGGLFDRTVVNPDDPQAINLNFSLIFPSELRIFHDTIISQGWKTNKPFEHVEKTEQHEPGDDGGYLGYIREGFASLHNAVSMSFIERTLGVENLPTIKLQRFPIFEHRIDPLKFRIIFVLPLVILVGYLLPYTNLTKTAVRVKEMHLVEVLRVLGINKLLEFCCWFALGFTLMFIASIMVTFMLTIKWSEGFGIFTKSSWLLIFLLLLCYNTASLCFCYLIASLTSRTATGVILVGVLWFLTLLPFLASKTEETITNFTFLMILVLSNTSMAMGLSIILDFEIFQEGLQLNNFFESVSDTHLSVGVIAFSLLGQGLLYLFVGLYMDRIKIRIATFYKCSYHIFLSLYGHSEQEVRTTKSSLSYRKSKIFEIEPEQKTISIEIKGLTKTCNNYFSLKDVSLNAYEGEITVIMGHNGAGKTLLLSLIVGIYKPTSGIILFDGTQELKDIYDSVSMGFCIDNILYPELTVANQIKFFCRLKGLIGDQLQAEVQKYLDAMNLKRVANKITRDLTDGQMRHLSACCALCGNSKFVVLDEPSTGMDLAARKMLWDLLLNEKSNRTIVITSHSTEEADVLADRLAILSGGELMCSGTAYFLREVYGVGYRLVCIKDSNCDSKSVTKFIQKYIPNIQPESDIGRELSYRLKENNATISSKLLAELEGSFFELHISGCSISYPMSEDIFLRMGAEDPSDYNRFRHKEIMNGFSIYAEEYEKLSFAKKYKMYTGIKLFISQYHAMITKRFFSNASRKKIILVQLLMPGFITLLTYMMVKSGYSRVRLPAIEFNRKYYTGTTIVETLQKGELDEYREEYIRFRDFYYKLAEDLGIDYSCEETQQNTISEFAIQKQKIFKFSGLKYINGVSYHGNEIIGWFNNYALHSVPVSLAMVHNALIRSKNYNNTITVIHHPLTYETFVDADDVMKITEFGNFLSASLTFIISFVFAYCVINRVEEKECRFKLLQYIHGMRPFLFFVSSMTFDIIKIIIISFLVYAIMFLYEHSEPQKYQSHTFCFQVLVVFGICITPFYYFVSHFFKDHLSVYAIISIYNVYSVALYIAVVVGLEIPWNEETWLWSLLPHYTLCKALIMISYREKVLAMCEHQSIKHYIKWIDECHTRYIKCCSSTIETPKLSWASINLVDELMVLVAYGILSAIFLFLIEYRKVFKNRIGTGIPADNSALAFEQYRRRHANASLDDADIVKEQLRIENLKESDYHSKPLVVSNMGKIYGEKVAVNRVSFMVERCECLTLLGVNGSGKSSIMKILAGDEEMSFGRVYVEGISLTADIFGMFERIGYTPEINAVPITLTCRQTLEFFCRIRGIPSKHITDVCECLSKVLGFTKRYNERISKISHGYKRRLGLAINMIGNPSVLYIDEPLTGIDPAGRRQVWNILTRLCQRGKAVVITTIDVRECESFSTRFGFIIDGTIHSLDTAHNLNSRYIQGYLLQVKLKMASLISNLSTISSFQLPAQLQIIPNPLMKLLLFVEHEFPDSVVRDQRGSIFLFFIPLENVTLAQIFKKMQRSAFNLNIESFSITQNSLSIIFLDLAIKERNTLD